MNVIKSRWDNDERSSERAKVKSHRAHPRKTPKDARQGEDREPPSSHKRRKIVAGAIGEDSNTETSAPRSLQEIAHLSPARHVTDYEQLNEIEEGSYGWVSRARQRRTGDIVALKKLKMGEGQARGGVPVTGLREIECLMASRDCAGIVRLREVVVGDALGDIYLVMDFIEHDLRTLQEDMLEPFLPSEVKALMLQLLRGVEFLHDHWILHRDLKTSNLLLNNRGGLKIADFGMARFYGNPAPPMTQLVVTLWYRSPELLLGASRYGSEVDTWSIGCIMAELLNKKPLMAGKNEVEQLAQIFKLVGIPTDTDWPGFHRLPNAKLLRLPRDPQPTVSLRTAFPYTTSAGVGLLAALLSLNPSKRPKISEALQHSYFSEDPSPKSSALFPTFPSRAGQEKRPHLGTPNAPVRGEAPELEKQAGFSSLFGLQVAEDAGAGFTLRVA